MYSVNVTFLHSQHAIISSSDGLCVCVYMCMCARVCVCVRVCQDRFVDS